MNKSIFFMSMLMAMLFLTVKDTLAVDEEGFFEGEAIFSFLFPEDTMRYMNKQEKDAFQKKSKRFFNEQKTKLARMSNKPAQFKGFNPDDFADPLTKLKTFSTEKEKDKFLEAALNWYGKKTCRPCLKSKT